MSEIVEMIKAGWKSFSLTENFYKMKYHPELPESHKKHLEKELFNAIEHFETEKKKVSGIDFIRGAHRQIDDYRNKDMVKEQKSKISCRKGCSFCCNLNVDITKEEAELLLESGVEIDWEKAKRQSTRTMKNWIEQPKEDRSCLFLSSAGECTVYDSRPIACRNQLVVSDPKNCDTEENNGAQTIRVNVWTAELIASAVWTVSEFGNMSEMLIKSKK